MSWNGKTITTTTASVSFDRDVFDLAEERRMELGMSRSRFISSAVEAKLGLRPHPELHVIAGKTPKGWLERAVRTTQKRRSVTQSISFDEELFHAMEKRREELRMSRAQFVGAVLESLLGILEHPELNLAPQRPTRRMA